MKAKILFLGFGLVDASHEKLTKQIKVLGMAQTLKIRVSHDERMPDVLPRTPTVRGCLCVQAIEPVRPAYP